MNSNLFCWIERFALLALFLQVYYPRACQLAPIQGTTFLLIIPSPPPYLLDYWLLIGEVSIRHYACNQTSDQKVNF